MAADPLPPVTLAELALRDGRNGRSSWVAVNGLVYDVSASQLWRNGFHYGNHAGQNLSAVLPLAPHTDRVLADFPVVGRLVTPA